MPFVKRVLSWFSAQERFLVVYAERERLTTFRFALNRERVLTSEQIEEHPRPVRERRKGTPAFPGPVIVAAGFPLAAIVVLPVHVERDNPKEPVVAVELENALAHTVGKAFTQSRKEASELFNIDELDVMLVGSAVGQFSVEGHRVVNPLGFAGKIVSAVLELTLTSREVLDDLYRLVGRRDFFFTHLGRAGMRGLERTWKKPFAFVEADKAGSWAVFPGAQSESPSFAQVALSWSPLSFLSSVERAWGIPRAAARRVYAAYREGRTSPRVHAFLGRLFGSDLDALRAQLALQKSPPRVCILSSAPFPAPFPFKKGNYTFTEPPLDQMLQNIGVAFRRGTGRTSSEWFVPIAPLVEWYADKSDSTINHWLRRHLNWLGASRG